MIPATRAEPSLSATPPTISVLLYANERCGQDEILSSVRALRDQDTGARGVRLEALVLLSAAGQQAMPLLEIAARAESHWLEVVTLAPGTSPAQAWTAGLHRARGSFVCFAWPGVRWWPDSFSALLGRLLETGAAAVFGPVASEAPGDADDSVDRPLVGVDPAHAEWAQMINLVPLPYTLWQRHAFDQVGGFLEDVHPRLADWELVRRATRIVSLERLTGTPASSRWSLATLPLSPGLPLPDERERRLALQTAVPGPAWTPEDLPARRRDGGPFRVAIVSGLYEGAQVQLCLLNHLEPLAAAGLAEWRVLFDEQLRPETLADYDVAFLVRSRTAAARRAAEFCHERGIRTVFLLDDDWFHAVETYPQLEEQIGRGTAAFRNFVTLLGSADFVLTYAEPLREDFSRWNERTILFPLNIDLTHFPSAGRPRDGRARVGFAGSASRTQFAGPALRGLARVMDERPEVDAVLRGLELPEDLRRFGERASVTPYVFDYRRYAREVAASGLDLMLSPLGDSRYTNSQCPNKYLEITAAGAVGLYSDIPLYRRVVRSGENGLLVPPSAEDWYRALLRLVTDPRSRERMMTNAARDVGSRFATPKVVPRFTRLLERVIEGPVNATALDFEGN